MSKKFKKIGWTKDELAKQLAKYSDKEAIEILRAARHLRKYMGLVGVLVGTDMEEELTKTIEELENE